MRFLLNPQKTALTRMTVALLAVALGATFGLLTANDAGAVPRAPQGFLNVVPQEGVTQADTARMHRGKVKNLRVAIAWGMVQPTSPKSFDWNAVDATVQVAAREGVTIMATLYASPPWMYRDSTRMPVDNQNRLIRWREFVKAAVERYGRGGNFWKEPAQIDSKLPVRPIVDWQLWNESNFHYFANPVSATRYARLYNAGAKVIRQVNPSANIVVAGLFARPSGPPKKAQYATSFIRQFAARVPNRYIDAIALHPYAKDTPTLKAIMRQFRGAANKAGLRSKPMYVTEIGWSSGPRRNSFMLGSEAAQARQLKSAFTYLLQDRHRLRLRKVFWFAWQDTNPRGENCSFCYNIGLFKWRAGNKLVAKPAWRTFVAFTRGRA